MPLYSPSTVAAGTLAARPAAASGNSGTLYFATDDYGGTLYRSDGSTWTIVGPRGIEFAHYENATSYASASLAAAAYEDVTSANITFTPRDRPIIVEAFVPLWIPGNAAARPRLVIRTGSTVVAINGYNAVNTNSVQGPRPFKRLVPGVDVTTGTPITYKLSIQNATGATASVITLFSTDQVGSPFGLRAYEV